MKEQLKLFSGNANLPLANSIARTLGVKPGRISVEQFADGEINVKILENVRGKDCYVVQPTCPPVNENVMELLIIIDALHRASAKSVTAVMPYYGYGRQDRKAEPRVPITAKLIANLITASGANRVVALDMHAGQLQGFFDIPVDNLYATPVFLEYLKSRHFTARAGKLCVVSPDAGGVERARAFGKKLRASLVIVDKRRPAPNRASVMHVIGDVRNKTTLVLDDIVDTAGTLLEVSAVLKKAGAREVIALATHGVLSGNAVENIDRSPLKQLIITDSIPSRKKSKKIVVLPVAGLLGRAIKRINNCESVSELFV